MDNKYITYSILIILLWMPLTGIIDNLTDGSLTVWLGRLYRLLIILISFIVLTSTKWKKYLKRQTFLFISLTIYLMFIYYETSYNIPIEARGVDDKSFTSYTFTYVLFSFIFYITLSIVLRNDSSLFDRIIKRYIPMATFCNVTLMGLILSKYGFIFLFTEALNFHGVTLIIFSYEIIFTLTAIIYAWNRKIISKRNALIFVIINLLLILSMGKRGSLLSIMTVVFCIWLFKNFSIKKGLLLLSLGIILYNLFTLYISDIISIMTSINHRLGTSFAAFYYYGDLNGRELLHEYAWEQIDMNPLWGKYPGLITPSPFLWCFGYHPHNIWIEAIMTMGYIGSIPFFILIAYISLMKIIPALSSNSYYMFFAFLFISEVTHGFMSGTLTDSKIWMAVCILYTFTNKKSIIYGKIARQQ